LKKGYSGNSASSTSYVVGIALDQFPDTALWYEKKTQSKLPSTSYTATAAPEATDEIKRLLELHEDVHSEIERLIGRIVVPYVDPSNSCAPLR